MLLKYKDRLRQPLVAIPCVEIQAAHRAGISGADTGPMWRLYLNVLTATPRVHVSWEGYVDQPHFIRAVQSTEGPLIKQHRYKLLGPKPCPSRSQGAQKNIHNNKLLNKHLSNMQIS